MNLYKDYSKYKDYQTIPFYKQNFKKYKETKIFYNFLRLKRVSILSIILKHQLKDKIICGHNFTCIHYSDGHIELFGDNEFGQCNVPDIKKNRVVQVACGLDHTCILLDDGSVRIFGSNEEGQHNLKKSKLKNHRVVQVACGYYHTCLLLDDGTVSIVGQCEYDIPTIEGKRIVRIASGYSQTFIQFDDGSSHQFGDDDQVPKEHRQVDAACGFVHSILLIDNGRVEILSTEFTEVPDLGDRKVVQAACGGSHICLLLDDGSIILFGDNEQGQCNQPELNGRKVIQVSCGEEHTCLMLEDETILMFGHDNFGQCSLVKQ